MDEKYYEDGVDRILRMMKDTFGDRYTYFNGELLNVGESYLPCIMVTETASQITSGATGTDDITETIIIIVVFNKKDDLGANDNVELTDYKLRKMVQGQDPVTGQYYPDSILGAVRKHLTMQNDTLQSDTQVNFTPNMRGGATAIATQEAYITVTVKRFIQVPVRD